MCIRDRDEAIQEIQPYVDKDTVIMPLLNGISPSRIIQEKCSKGIILPGFTVKTDGQRVGNIISYESDGNIVFGHDTPEKKAIAERAAYMLDQSGVPFEFVDNIQYRQWWKLMANVGINQTQALLNGPYKIFHQEHAANIARLAMKETVVIANQLDLSLIHI